MLSVNTGIALLKFGLEEIVGQCVLLFPMFGVSPQALSRVATSVMVDPTKQRKEKNVPPTEYLDIPSFIALFRHNTTDLTGPQLLLKD